LGIALVSAIYGDARHSIYLLDERKSELGKISDTNLPNQASEHLQRLSEEKRPHLNTISTLNTRIDILARFRSTRARTLALVEPLTPEDMMVQSCPEASPVKWHLAHTSWFFESFVLREFGSGYKVFNPDFTWLFNSYYQSFAAFPEKRLRASFSRPALDEILRYRQHVEEGIERLFDSGAEPEALRRIELGVNHEEQHQELLLTDILHAFFTNPLRPAYRTGPVEGGVAPPIGFSNGHPAESDCAVEPIRFIDSQGGLREVGHDSEEFCFDNERPRHRVWLEPHRLATRLVTCGEFAEFIAEGGYRRPELWLSAGWDAVQQNGWRAPLYWSGENGDWRLFTLRGEIPLRQRQAAPLSHVSYFEADAYARWAGRRLATEFEWESAAEEMPLDGNLLDSGNLMPVRACGHSSSLVQNQGRTQCQLWGDCWEWTSSAYLGYPGFRPLPGALGEYNGKFMSGQMVLRGGSCVTPSAHIRASYRNFFAPETRWQFSGIRLAE
jgi:ergothioneine biosynthesis protein EgtB